MKRISIFLITLALIAGMVGCGGGGVTRYQLTMAVAGGNGTATDLTNASPYAAGTAVSIKAVAAPGYGFHNWTAPAGTFANANAPQTTFTMPAQNATVTANFVIGIPVSDWYDLDAIRDNLSGNYTLMNDLDSTTAGYEDLASPTANGGKGWQPIGTFSPPPGGNGFMGTFDGQGYEIGALLINRPGEDYVGLFGSVEGAGAIQGIGVANVTVIGGNVTGGLVGGNGGTVTYCYSTGNVTGQYDVGGLVGFNFEEGTVSHSHSSGSVIGDDYVGGLAGPNGGTVSYCHSTGSVIGYDYVGGLVGFNFENGAVSDSYSTGSVSGQDGVGGLVGVNLVIVSQSYSTGSVTANSAVGGLVGTNYQGTVNDSYSTGSVTGTSYVGGLVGGNVYGAMSDCYSTGNVTGNSSVGGLVGYDRDGTVSDSFWDTQTSGQATSDGGTGKTTAEMKDITIFSGATWNIIGVANPSLRNLAYIWNIVDDETYPFLSWQPVS